MVFTLGLGLALGFQTPIVVLLLGWVGIVDRAFLRKHRKAAMMICAVLGAVLTPADPMSMVVLTVPLYALYEFGMLLLLLVPPSRFAAEDEEDKDVPEPPDAGDA
jgi:sec-independent protein translocase protein TatC